MALTPTDKQEHNKTNANIASQPVKQAQARSSWEKNLSLPTFLVTIMKNWKLANKIFYFSKAELILYSINCCMFYYKCVGFIFILHSAIILVIICLILGLTHHVSCFHAKLDGFYVKIHPWFGKLNLHPPTSELDI